MASVRKKWKEEHAERPGEVGDYRSEDATGHSALQAGDDAQQGGGQDEQRDPGRGRDEGIDRRGDGHCVAPADPGIQGPAEIELLGDPVDRGDDRNQGQRADGRVREQAVDGIAQRGDPGDDQCPGQEEGQKQPAQDQRLNDGMARVGA